MFGHLYCYVVLCVLSSFAIILGEKTAYCFTLTVFLMSCDWQCSVVLPHGAVVGLRCVTVLCPGHTRVLF